MRTNSLTDSMQKEVNERLWRFVEQNGGVKELADRTGLTAQTFYNIGNNRGFPSAATLAVIKKHYPKVDVNVFISHSSVDSGSLDAEPVQAEFTSLDRTVEWLQQQLSQAQAQVAKLQQRNDKLEEQKDALTMALLEKTHPNLFADKPGVKLGADYHLTEVGFGVNTANVPFVAQG